MASDNDFDLKSVEAEKVALASQGIGAIIQSLSYGDTSSDGSSIVGDDQFLFISGGSNYWNEQISGHHRISDEDFESSLSTLSDIKNECAARSIAFSLVVIPEKDLVYPDKSPNCRGITLGERPVHQLQAAFPDTLYPLPELRAATGDALLYHKRDSHFNFFGGLIIFNSIAAILRIEPLEYDSTPSMHAPWQDDLAVKWEKYPTIRRTLCPEYDELVIKSGTPLTGHHMKLTAKFPTNNDCAVIYGDSYAWNPDAGLSRFLTRRFKTVHFIWSRRIDWDLITELGPTALIVESAERFLIGGLFRA